MLSKMLLPAHLGALLLLATSCTVYAPMQPTTPLVQQRGQAEVGASVQVLGRVEATGAYSPIRHVVLAGGLTGSPRLGKAHFLLTAQYEAGAGLYQALGKHWLLSEMGGFGQAYSHRGYTDLPIPYFGSSYSEYEARYHKLYGQLGIAHVQEKDTYSLTYRLTRVQFAYLTAAEYGPLPLSTMLRHELAFAVRNSLRANSHWQIAITMGMSIAGTPKLDDNIGYPTYSKPEYEANRNLLPAFLGSVGAVYRLGQVNR